ncbi:hypothetical protein AB3Y40_01260 [Yoonia sp. R2331]|uniref:hypothetical protein n=1 Tax=Yoonia sp. R2331 TaxID=3237238 RepID=UPI0034E5C369
MPYRPSMRTLCALTGLTVLLYLSMVFGPLARLQAIASAPPLDMRPFGYAPDDAKAFLNALGSAGRSLYLTRQIPLDMIYPGLLALTLAGWLRWLGRKGAAVAVAASLCDYIENLLIVGLLLTYPEMPDGPLVWAGWATVLKSGLSTVAFSWLLIAGTISACRSIARRHARPGQRKAIAGTKHRQHG